MEVQAEKSKEEDKEKDEDKYNKLGCYEFSLSERQFERMERQLNILDVIKI